MKLESLADLAAAAAPCPYCGGALEPTSVCVAGLAIVVDARCPGCGVAFTYDWPAGHALLHPVLVDRQTGVVQTGGRAWYAWRFARLLASQEAPASVEITVQGECREGRGARLVNCLDFLYSHALLKLMSAARHMHESPEDDVVVVIPRVLRRLVPPGAVVIEVDLPLSSGDEWVESLDATVEDVLAPSRAVRISPAVSQPDVTPRDLAFLGEDLTPLSRSAQRAAPLQIGFSLRDDRLWLGPPGLWIRLARRLLPSRLAHRVLLRRQHRNYARLARRLRERHPEARLVAFGMGRSHGLPSCVEDVRTPGPSHEEAPWLDEYRRCRVVVGVHGANLLLPSLLAGSTVDLLPAFKLRDVTQDLLIPRESVPESKLSLFRYRIVPEECRPDTVAAIVLSVMDDADLHHRNIIDNRRAYDTPGWLRPITWRQVASQPSAPHW